ncbi:MAG: AtpZ/AtpI family protein [Chloroflexi bacterium]|nr:AtpZ/AtpI family protein [Chloroflexota bacterium]
MSKPDKQRYAMNLALAAVASQVGLLTTFIIIVSLLLGLWLDARFNTRPLWTVILLVASVPVTLVLMFWIVRRTVSRITPSTTPKQEEQRRGESNS